MAGRGAAAGGPSKAQQDQWNEKAMQLLKRHDQNGDGLLDPREMASAMNELCGTHGLSARSLTAALGLDSKLDNSSYRWTPVEFCDIFRRAMLMADSGEAAGSSGGAGGGGSGGGRGMERLLGPAVDTLRDLDAKSEASLKQCYNNYCRLTGASGGSGGKVLMDGDMKMSAAQWHQLCGDVGLAAPVGPISPSDLAAIFSTASQRTSGLTMKQFLTALAMISPDVTTLCNHMVAQLGPQMRPRPAGGDGPQPASFPLRNLDLRAAAAAQGHWGAAHNVISAANAFMKAAAGGGGCGVTEALGVRSSGSSFTSSALVGGGGGAAGSAFAVEIEEALTRSAVRYSSPAASRTGGPPEPLAPIVGGPITAKLGGAGIKRSSLTSLGAQGLAVGAGGPRASSGGSGVGLGKSLDMPSSQMVQLDRLAAVEARITQLEQQQAFAREMMAAASAGGSGGTGRGGAAAGGGGTGGGCEGLSGPQVAALEAKIAALEAELVQVAPGADASRQVREVRDGLELLTERVEAIGKSLERAAKRVEAAEATARAAEEQVRQLQAPVTEANASLASLRQATDQLKAAQVSKESELLQQLVTRISGTEGQLEALEGQLRKLVREGKLAAALPSKEALTAALAAGGGAAEVAAAPQAPSTPTTGGGGPVTPTPPPGPKPPPKSMGSNGSGGGGGGANGDYFVQSLGVVQLDTEEDIRLQIKLLTEAMDNVKRRLNQIAGSNQLNPIDFPTRNELNEVKKVVMADIADIDAKYIKVQKEVGSLSLKMPALEKKVEGSALGSGTQVVSRLVSLGMARLVDVKETENYLVDRSAGTAKQFENLRRDMQDFQGDLQSNMEKLVTQFNSINRQLMEAKREAAAPAAAAVAAAVGGGGGGGAASAATAATAASAAATAAQTASEARAAVERERADRERETRELRERLTRAESHLGGALGELQTVVGAELSCVKEVLAQLEAAMNQADGEALRLVRERDGGLRSALCALEKASNDQNEMTGKVIMKMARQITEMQVKLRELATALAASQSQQCPASPLASPSALQVQQQHPHRESDPAMPFAARLLAGAGAGAGAATGELLNAPNSPSMAGRREYLAAGGPRTSMTGAGGGGGGGGRCGTPQWAECGGGGGGGGEPGRRTGASPARGMLAADPPPAPGSRLGGPRLSETGALRASSSNSGGR